MNTTTVGDPFHIVRNYRKMVARRDRHHKKRKPKCYPPTNIKTRSMELRQHKLPSQEILQLEHYDSMPPQSSSWYDDTDSREVLLLNGEDYQQIEDPRPMAGGGMDEEIMELMEADRLLGHNEPYMFWDNEPNNDLNDHELLQIH